MGFAMVELGKNGEGGYGVWLLARSMIAGGGAAINW